MGLSRKFQENDLQAGPLLNPCVTRLTQFILKYSTAPIVMVITSRKRGLDTKKQIVELFISIRSINRKVMIINEQLKNILATGDEQKINEIVATSLEVHKNYDRASQEPNKWCMWAGINPRDALRLINQWVNEGKDVSMFASYFKPDLTPCETFANALGYAKHLKLKEFLFRNYGSYSYAMHTYSTTKVRNNGGGTAPIGQSVVTHSKAYDDYASRFNDGPGGGNTNTTPNATETQPMIDSPKLGTPRTVPPQDDKMALRMTNRSDPRFNGARLDREFTKLNEVKQLIRETMLKEMKKI